MIKKQPTSLKLEELSVEHLQIMLDNIIDAIAQKRNCPDCPPPASLLKAQHDIEVELKTR